MAGFGYGRIVHLLYDTGWDARLGVGLARMGIGVGLVRGWLLQVARAEGIEIAAFLSLVR